MGVIPAAGRSVYSSMKFALRGQTLSLAKEFKRTKPRFVLLTLGSVLTSFGPKSMDEKRKEMEGGKSYLSPEYVAKKIMEIINTKTPEEEYTIYPSGYTDEWDPY
jgi:short-subunit dehydrogenase